MNSSEEHTSKTTQSLSSDTYSGKVTGENIPTEKTGESQKLSDRKVGEKIPDSIQDLFSILLETAFKEYFANLPQELDNQGGSPNPDEKERQALLQEFARFAANNPVIGYSFFLSLEQPTPRVLDATATRDIERRAAEYLRNNLVTPPVDTAEIRDENEHARDAKPIHNPEEKQAEPTHEEEIDTPLENHILQTHQQYGWQGINQFRQQMAMHMANDTAHRANFDKQIELILRKHGIGPDRDPVGEVAGLPDELTGSFEEIALQTSMLLKKHVGDARFALEMTAGPLAQAVERMEKIGLSREKQVDLMIHAFAGEPVYTGADARRPPCNPGFLQFMARLRAMLADDAQKKTTPDLLETQVNLTTWYGQARSDKCLTCGLNLALKILPAFFELKEERVRVAKMLHQLANNTAGWLSTLLGFKSNEESMDNEKREQAVASNTLHALGTVAFLRQEPGQGWDTNAAPIYAVLGAQTAQSMGSMARAFLFMSNVPSAWRVFGRLFTEETARFGNATPRFRTAVLSLLSALMRARFNAGKDGNEIASALFNLGVDISLHAKQKNNAPRFTPLRVLANGLGLWWALSRARNDDEAIGAFNGGDCAVNLFGALTEKTMEQAVRDQEKNIRKLGETVHTQLKNDMDAVRLGNSYKQLFGEEPKPTTTFDRVAAAKTLTEILYFFLADWKVAGISSSDTLASKLQDDFPVTAATFLQWAFLHTEQGGDTYRRCVDGWIAVATKLVTLAEGEDYTMFRGLISATLSEFGLQHVCKDYPDSIDTHFLSRTLRDKTLMRSVFGLPG
ncbi:MAG: hypothetical protein HY777_10565 [Betaproteobacteria bacterium]|nr:hypothetical protein [Betaproteobacteria bacterium]